MAMQMTSVRRSEIYRALLLVVCSAASALLVVELVARLLFPAPLQWLYPQVRYRSDGALGFALVPNQRSFTADKPVEVNARGLRGRLVPYLRVAGVQRLLFLGDSIGFGYGVDEGRVTASVVATLMKENGWPTEVINAGVPAYNTEQEVVYLEQNGVLYQPDWVILQVCWNDIADKSEVRVNPLGSLVLPGEQDSHRRAQTSFWESEHGYDLRNLLKRSRLLYVAMRGVSAMRGAISRDQQSKFREEVLLGTETDRMLRGRKRLGSALRRLNELAQAHGFRVLVVTYPIPYALEKRFPYSSYPATFAELARREAFPVIDLYEPYRSVYHGHTSLFIPYDGDHPNAEGHRIAAEEIARYLMEWGSKGETAQK